MNYSKKTKNLVSHYHLDIHISFESRFVMSFNDVFSKLSLSNDSSLLYFTLSNFHDMETWLYRYRYDKINLSQLPITFFIHKLPLKEESTTR